MGINVGHGGQIAHGSHCQLGSCQPLGGGLDIRHAHAVHQLGDLLRLDHVAGQQNLSANIFNETSCASLYRENICDQVLLSSGHLRLGHGSGSECGRHCGNHLAGGSCLSHHHGSQKTSITVHRSNSSNRVVRCRSGGSGLGKLALASTALNLRSHAENALQQHTGQGFLDTGGSRSCSSEGNIGQISSSLQSLLSTVELGGHAAASCSLLKAQQFSILNEVSMRNSHTDKGSSAGRIVLGDELLELGGPVASRLVGSGVEGVSQARPESSKMKKL